MSIVHSRRKFQSNFSVLKVKADQFFLHVITSITSVQYLPVGRKERIMVYSHVASLICKAMLCLKIRHCAKLVNKVF